MLKKKWEAPPSDHEKIKQLKEREAYILRQLGLDNGNIDLDDLIGSTFRFRYGLIPPCDNDIGETILGSISHALILLGDDDSWSIHLYSDALASAGEKKGYLSIGSGYLHWMYHHYDDLGTTVSDSETQYKGELTLFIS